MTPYERSVRENLPPPDYWVWEAAANHWFWDNTKSGARAKIERRCSNRKEACLAAWDHFEGHRKQLEG